MVFVVFVMGVFFCCVWGIGCGVGGECLGDACVDYSCHFIMIFFLFLDFYLFLVVFFH